MIRTGHSFPIRTFALSVSSRETQCSLIGFCRGRTSDSAHFHITYSCILMADGLSYELGEMLVLEH